MVIFIHCDRRGSDGIDGSNVSGRKDNFQNKFFGSMFGPSYCGWTHEVQIGEYGAEWLTYVSTDDQETVNRTGG